jgi:SAM-dependent methyltransferase
MIRINQIKNFFKKKNKFSLRSSDYNIFRLLKLNSFKNKKVLDIGYGNGENLIEFDKRGAIPFGISLVDYKKYLKNFLSNYSANNFFHLDLNRNSLTKCLEKSENLSGATRIRINKERERERVGEGDNNKDYSGKKFDVIICIDTIYYIQDLKNFFIQISKILKKNCFFLFQYIECQYRPNFNNFDLKNSHLVGNIKNYTKYKEYSNNENPIIFLKNKNIKKYISDSGLIYLNSTFNYNTYVDYKKNTFLHKNIYTLLKKVL